MLALGFLAGLANWVWLGRREGRSFNTCSDLLFWIMVAGIVGARLAYVLANAGEFAARPASVFRIDQGGLVFYGGFVGAALAIWGLARFRRESVWGLYDFVVVSVPLAHAFGRVGCFLNGCCYGRVCEGFPRVSFPAASLPWSDHLRARLIQQFDSHSLPVHPVQLYSAAVNLLIYLGLVWLYRRRPGAGVTTAAYVLAYALARFALEFLRGDQQMDAVGPLDAAQLVSLLLAALGAALLVFHRRRRKRQAISSGGSA
jgi:phosphatidylglycerol:prolipoprotein diacylglycerol transferase